MGFFGPLCLVTNINTFVGQGFKRWKGLDSSSLIDLDFLGILCTWKIFVFTENKIGMLKLYNIYFILFLSLPNKIRKKLLVGVVKLAHKGFVDCYFGQILTSRRFIFV